MVQFLGTTQAGSLAQNRRAGLNTLALPLSHFLEQLKKEKRAVNFRLSSCVLIASFLLTSPLSFISWVFISEATNQRCSFITRVDGGSCAVPVPEKTNHKTKFPN